MRGSTKDLKIRSGDFCFGEGTFLLVWCVTVVAGSFEYPLVTSSGRLALHFRRKNVMRNLAVCVLL